MYSYTAPQFSESECLEYFLFTQNIFSSAMKEMVNKNLEFQLFLSLLSLQFVILTYGQNAHEKFIWLMHSLFKQAYDMEIVPGDWWTDWARM